MAQGDTLLNATLGAVVSILLSFLPFAAVLGGAVAGYLQVSGRDVREGARVGAVSGLIALVPVLFIFLVLGAVLPFLPSALGALSTVVLVVALIVAAGYFVGAGAVGGVLGAYLRAEL